MGENDNPSDVLKLGDKVKVKVKEIDNLGRVNFSIRALLPKPEGCVEQSRPPRSGGSGKPRGGGRGPRGPTPRRTIIVKKQSTPEQGVLLYLDFSLNYDLI